MRPSHLAARNIRLLFVPLAALLPSALHAQVTRTLSRPPVLSQPQPRPSVPAYPVQSYPYGSVQQSPSPLQGAPAYAQGGARQYGTTVMPSRGPVYSVPSYPLQNNFPTQNFSGPAYRNSGPIYRNYGQVSNSAPFASQPGSGQTNAPSFTLRGTITSSPGTATHRHHGGGDSYNYSNYGGAAGYNYGSSYYGSDYGTGVTVIGGPALLGGYYYNNYSDTYTAGSYPSVYSGYSGFPNYIYSPASVIVLADPYAPAYVTGYQPFYTPAYPVVYNQNIYYVGSQERAQQITGDDETARKAALSNAYPEGSYQAAFGDIERAWLDNNISVLQKHLRGSDIKLSVFFKGKYSYSIATSDYLQITRDAFDKISTVSFKFNRLRKAKNGDVTAFGTHVYRGTSDSETAGSDSTVPFSADGAGASNGGGDTAAPGAEKIINVAYTVRHQDGKWNIVAIDSSPATSSL